jgi:hypothetical protein
MEEAGAGRLGIVAQLRDASWSYLLGVAFFIVCVCLVFRMAAPASLQPLSRDVLRVAPLLPLLAKMLAALPAFLERLRAGAREPVEMAAMWRSVAAPLVGACRYQLIIWRGFAACMRRARPPALPAGQPFGFLERSSYSTFVAICVFSTLVDLPLNGFILSVMVRDPHTRHVLHLVLAPLALYMLYWVVSDRWLMRASGHVLTDSSLELKLGGRVECRVPLDAIARCEPVSEAYLAWCSRHHVRRRDALAVTPLDRPNVVLVLKPQSGVAALHMGTRRDKLSHVFVYVDAPGQLVTALRKATAAADE